MKPPNNTQDNKALADSKLAADGMMLAATQFLEEMRLGTSSSTNLGYNLCSNKLVDQEIHIITKTVRNAVAKDITDGVNNIFSGNWQGVVQLAVRELVGFLSGQ